MVTVSCVDLGDDLILETEPGEGRQPTRYYVRNLGERQWRIGEPAGRTGRIRILEPEAREQLGLPVMLHLIDDEEVLHKRLDK